MEQISHFYNFICHIFFFYPYDGMGILSRGKNWLVTTFAGWQFICPTS